MREKVFRKPSVRDVLKMQKIELPKKINGNFVLSLMNNGIIDYAGDSYEEAVGKIEALSSKPKTLLLFSSKFRVPKSDSDYGIKSLDDLIKIDSQKVLRDVSGEENVPSRLTREFAEKYKIWPSTLVARASKYEDVEKPPVGFYWVGFDGHVSGTTWLRSTVGAEMEVMKRKGDFQGEILDKKPYGRNLRVKVNSRTEEEVIYEFSLFRLPMHWRGDLSQFSDWINLSHNSSDPDASYRGGEHEKRVYPVTIWSATSIFAFYEAMSFVEQHPGWKQFRINPFPIPKNEDMIDHIDNLRLRSLIFHEDEKSGRVNIDVLNKYEIDKFIGAKTILRKYNNCWRHWGKEDVSYLYKPLTS